MAIQKALKTEISKKLCSRKKTEISAKIQAFQEKDANYKLNFDKEVARGAGFDSAVSRALSFRVLQFLSSNGAASLREVADGIGERVGLVGHCLRRLWKKELILRTREPCVQV